MEKEQRGNVEFIQKLQELIKTKKITQKEIAKQTGYSVAAISTYLNGRYAGNLETFEAEIEKFLSLFNQKSQYKRIKLKFEKTSIAKSLFTIARIAQFNSEIGLCFGHSGLGKTTAIKEYAKQQSGVIILDPDEKATPRALLKQLAAALKMSDCNCLMEVFTADIVKKLKGSGKLIIIDESENLSVEHFRVLRKIHDRCDFTIGMLFVGTYTLYNNLVKLQGEYNYIKNRICYVESLEKMEHEDVKLLVSQVYPNSSEEIINSFAQYSDCNARVLFNMMKRINDLIICNGDTLSSELVCKSRQLLL